MSRPLPAAIVLCTLLRAADGAAQDQPPPADPGSAPPTALPPAPAPVDPTGLPAPMPGAAPTPPPAGLPQLPGGPSPLPGAAPAPPLFPPDLPAEHPVPQEVLDRPPPRGGSLDDFMAGENLDRMIALGVVAIGGLAAVVVFVIRRRRQAP